MIKICPTCLAAFNARKERIYCSIKCHVRIGNKNPKWRGGRINNGHGYILKFVSEGHPYKSKSGYVFEHRLVMEKLLNRYLKPKEYVHHINGIKSDNRIENLKLVSKSEHNTIHFKSNLNTCAHSGCTRPFFANGVCKTHYHREWARKHRKIDPNRYHADALN